MRKKAGYATGVTATLDPKWNPSVRSRPCAPAFEPAPDAGSWRGCGLSDRDGVAFTFEKLVEDLEAFIEAVDCEQFALFGMVERATRQYKTAASSAGVAK